MSEQFIQWVLIGGRTWIEYWIGRRDGAMGANRKPRPKTLSRPKEITYEPLSDDERERVRKAIADIIMELAKRRAAMIEDKATPETRRIELREQARKILSDE